MIIVYPSHHLRHRPPAEVFNGNPEAHAEVPERIEQIRASLEGMEGMRIVLPKRFPLSWIEAVHDRAYVSYLARAGRGAGSNYVYPSVFPYVADGFSKQEVGERGQFCFDTYTPVSASTYESAHASAMAALTAASLVRRGERVVYALCRPPGHHAERSRMGGYCYFNNAAVAAHYLSRRGKVAVLDVDVHHGNGTQGIFYDRADVLVVSIHGDPDSLFPYFTGRATEQGRGKGEGYTQNIPLPLGTKDHIYDTALEVGLRRIREYKPDYLVVSVGYDAHKDDPIGRFGLTSQYYSFMARQIAGLNIPTVLVQEGGYNISTIGLLAQNFVTGFLQLRK